MARTISHPHPLPHTEPTTARGNGDSDSDSDSDDGNGDGNGNSNSDGSAHPGGAQQPVSAGRTATAPAGCVDHRTAAYVILVTAPLITADHH
ncbi:hypothetical protein TPA0910_72840 [Streptomyces hygroscopicus subsp. sporocinereus]|uniref:Uncharacterized protein n=1 Tax=Streptomyces hygroscopicus TaxID=1912 RepID=A0ABQ3UBR8_STRHY|nr:hypothetical protein [Streptomyces hygroscopicus]GHJ32851.1 hypothetical protein TPA0910_72840 [Streptomyces hygroscopicus]